MIHNILTTLFHLFTQFRGAHLWHPFSYLLLSLSLSLPHTHTHMHMCMPHMPKHIHTLLWHTFSYSSLYLSLSLSLSLSISLSPSYLSPSPISLPLPLSILLSLPLPTSPPICPSLPFPYLSYLLSVSRLYTHTLLLHSDFYGLSHVVYRFCYRLCPTSQIERRLYR